jgi:adenylylsulfate kinase-like enzyme
MKKFAIIIRGPTAAGKSTTSQLLKEQLQKTVHLEVDVLRRIISHKPCAKRRKIAHKAVDVYLNELTKYKDNIIIEEVFRKPYYLKVCNFFKKKKYVLLRVFLSAPLKVLVHRDKTRKTKTLGKKSVSKMSKVIKPFDEDLYLDTSKTTPKECAKLIMKKLKPLIKK